MKLWINGNVFFGPFIKYGVNDDRVASIPVQVQVESCKHVNQDLYAKFAMKCMGTSFIVEHDDEFASSTTLHQ